jgi:hypothetical protein
VPDILHEEFLPKKEVEVKQKSSGGNRDGLVGGGRGGCKLTLPLLIAEICNANF